MIKNKSIILDLTALIHTEHLYAWWGYIAPCETIGSLNANEEY